MTVDGLGSFIVNYGLGSAFRENQIVLSNFLAVAFPGDYNQNGRVDAADYVVWRKTLGQMGTSLAADGNGNGQIDSGDYNVWRAHFGQIAGSGSLAKITIPEPATFVMLLIGAFALFTRQREAVS